MDRGGTTRKSSLWNRQVIFSGPATVVGGSGVSVVRCVLLVVAVDELCLMLCPCRDTLLDMSARYLWVQWCDDAEEVSTTKYRQKMRGILVDCKIKTKTKLRSTTDTKAILIVGGPQLIVNTRTQVSHRWKVLEGNGTMT